ncbi:MAG: ribosome-associated translation inhibitor RaiA [Cryomorphaceae bacterium]|nr:ribosome-associated translation inhibitor RaiA [Cryomorphaceae bacterium]
MEVNLQSVNFNADAKLVDFIHKKIGKLEQVFDRITAADIYLKVENTSAKENKIAEIKVSVPGSEYVCKKQCSSFEEAADSSIDVLRRQLRNHKEKVRIA